MNLNAEVITLLTSISSKNLDNYIMDLQGQALNQLQLRLTDPNEGQRVLKLLLPFLPIAKISQLCNLIAEPWWLNLLRLWRPPTEERTRSFGGGCSIDGGSWSYWSSTRRRNLLCHQGDLSFLFMTRKILELLMEISADLFSLLSLCGAA